MSSTISYRPLFQVDIAHDYFLGRGDSVFEALSTSDQAAITALWSVPDMLDIVPTDATLATLGGHRMLWRATPGGMLVAVALDTTAPDQRPFIPPVPTFALSFTLQVRDPRFANYTELGAASTGFYRFGNDSLNAVAGTRFLTRPVPSFDTTRRYIAGEVYAQAAGTIFDLFLALRDTGPAVLPVPVDWRRIPADTFDAAATYRAGALVLAANQVYRALVDGPGGNLANAADWQPVLTLGNQYATAADQATPTDAQRGHFGVIEIGLSSGDFALLAADGSLRAPRYVLRFLNRATRWRYIFPAAQAVGSGADVAQEAGDARVLVSAAPRPLTRFGTGGRLQADAPATTTVSEEILLPVPETHRLRREASGWYSETRVPNLTVGP